MGVIIRLAHEEDKSSARKIVREQYLKSGYLPTCEKVFFNSLDIYQPYSYTLVAIDNGQTVGTLTLIVDSSNGLPMDKLYLPENDDLRNQKRSLSELSQFAVVDGNVKTSLLLCKHALVLACRILCCTDIVITVNPKHYSFYKKVLKFHKISSEKEHPFLQSAKTVPLRLNLLTMEEIYKSFSLKKRGFNLHDYFFGNDCDAIERELHVAIN